MSYNVRLFIFIFLFIVVIKIINFFSKERCSNCLSTDITKEYKDDYVIIRCNNCKKTVINSY